MDVKKQSKWGSLTETIISVAIGFLVSMAITAIVFPLYDIPVSVGTNFQITTIYTISSIIRGYFVRRFFARLHA